MPAPLARLEREPRLPAPITIRSLARGDAPAVAALSLELGYPVDPADMDERLAAVLAAPGHAVFGAEDEEGSLAGWVHICMRFLLIDSLSAFVEALVVRADARRRGVGRALMAAAEDWARARGGGCVRLRSAAIREEAHAFYRALGYSPGKAALGFEKDLGPGRQRCP